jgi:hypothetical protein
VSALDDLFWRDEILQALFWMRGEGLAKSATTAELARFLAVDQAQIARILEDLADQGYVNRLTLARGGDEPGESSSGFQLTPLGVEEGGRRFRDEFAGLTRQAHGECSPGCWCHDPEHEGDPCPSSPRSEPETASV